MTDIMQIASEYEASKTKSIVFRSELNSLKLLTDTCNNMSDSLLEVIEDQNEYQIEIDTYNNEISKLEASMQDEIDILIQEINDVYKGKKNQDLSEEDKNKVTDLYGQIDKISNTTNTDINNLLGKKQATVQKSSDVTSQINIANKFADSAISKGSEYMKLEDKYEDKENKFIHMILNGVFQKVVAGENAVAAGENLLDKTAYITKLNLNITKSAKN